MDLPIARRVADIRAMVQRAMARPHVRLSALSYLSPRDPGADTFWHGVCPAWWDESSRYHLTERLDQADIVLLMAFGEDLRGVRAFLRERRGFSGLLCLWLHDNHVARERNEQAVRECDLFFCSHTAHQKHLWNDVSFSGPILPACLRATTDEIAGVQARFPDLPRLSKVVAPYFMYDLSPRTPLLHRIHAECPEAVCFFTPQEARQTDYYSLPAGERYMRWLVFKSSIVLPLHNDLSTRVFDGLAWGHTVLVPEGLPGFDDAIPPDDAAALGIVRFPVDGGIPAIRAAARQAIALFDAMGAEGVARRLAYVGEKHTLDQRYRAVLRYLDDIAADRAILTGVPGRNGGIGLKALTGMGLDLLL